MELKTEVNSSSPVCPANSDISAPYTLYGWPDGDWPVESRTGERLFPAKETEKLLPPQSSHVLNCNDSAFAGTVPVWAMEALSKIARLLGSLPA